MQRSKPKRGSGRTAKASYMRTKRSKCRFCKEKRIVDHKDVKALQKFSTPQGKIFSRKRSGSCARHQRELKRAIKRARFLALLPYGRH